MRFLAFLLVLAGCGKDTSSSDTGTQTTPSTGSTTTTLSTGTPSTGTTTPGGTPVGTTSTTSTTTLSDGLVFYDAFDGNLVEAVSGDPGDASSVASFTTDPWGNPNSALAVDGCVRHPDLAIPESDGFALSMWVRRPTPPSTTGPGFASLVSYHFWGAWQAFWDGSVLNVEVYQASPRVPTFHGAAMDPDPGTDWVHLVLSVDSIAGTATVWQDGVPVDSPATIPTAVQGAQTEVMIGCGFSGEVDEHRIYSRPLTQAEVDMLYTNAP